MPPQLQSAQMPIHLAQVLLWRLNKHHVMDKFFLYSAQELLFCLFWHQQPSFVWNCSSMSGNRHHGSTGKKHDNKTKENTEECVSLHIFKDILVSVYLCVIIKNHWWVGGCLLELESTHTIELYALHSLPIRHLFIQLLSEALFILFIWPYIPLRTPITSTYKPPSGSFHTRQSFL